MELELNKRYLIDRLQFSKSGGIHDGLRVIICVEVSKKAYKLEHENESSAWYLKEWEINIIEELDNEVSISHLFY